MTVMLQDCCHVLPPCPFSLEDKENMTPCLWKACGLPVCGHSCSSPTRLHSSTYWALFMADSRQSAKNSFYTLDGSRCPLDLRIQKRTRNSFKFNLKFHWQQGIADAAGQSRRQEGQQFVRGQPLAMAVWQSRWKALAAPGGRTVCVCKWGVVTWNSSWVTAFSKAHGLASGQWPPAVQALQRSGRWTQRWIKQVASVLLLEVWLGWTGTRIRNSFRTWPRAGSP